MYFVNRISQFGNIVDVKKFTFKFKYLSVFLLAHHYLHNF